MNGFEFPETLNLLGIATKGAVLLAVTGLAASALHRASAATRHGVWFLGMAGLLLLPVAALVTPSWVVEVPGGVMGLLPDVVPARTPSLAGDPDAVGLPGGAGPEILFPAGPLTTAGPSDASNPTRTSLTMPTVGQVLAIVFWLWVGGAAVLLITFLAGLAALARLKRRSPPFTDRRVTALKLELALAMGIRGHVPVLRGRAGAMPMSWGLVRRVILLPEGAERWDDFHLQAVLRHELAHVRRCDCLTQAVAEVSLALHWLNPLAWLAARRLRVEREHACDDAVLLGGARPSDYALALIDLAASARPLPTRLRVAATMIRPVHLKDRLRAVLDEGRARRSSRLGAAAAAALAVVLVSAVAAFTPAAGTGADMQTASPSEESTSTPEDVPVDASQDPRAVAQGAVESGASAKQLARVVSPVIERSDGALPIVVERAQIRGRITDALTGAPLRDAQVRRVGSDVVGVSSESGSYALIDVPAGTHELRVERVGYAPQARIVALTQDALLETDFALTPESAADIVSEIARTGIVESARVAVPRISIQGAGNVDSRAGERPIIYVDGVRVSPPDTSVLSRLSPDEIERIEIIKGPAAIERFGPAATAGVIQIFLKKPPSVPDLDSNAASMRAGPVFGLDEVRLKEPLILLDRVQLNQFGDGEDPVTIHVKNNNFNDATLWLVRRGGRVHLGTVTGKMEASFTTPVTSPADVWRVEIDLVGGEWCQTKSLTVDPGDVLDLLVAVDVSNMPECYPPGVRPGE